MDFKYVPDRSGLEDDLAAKFSASLAPFLNDVVKTLGIAGPDDPEGAMFAIPPSSISNDLVATERPLCAKCSNLNDEALHSEEGFIHSQSLEDLCGSAQTCALCHLMRLKLWEEMVWSRESCDDSPHNACFTDAQLSEGLRKLAAERGVLWPEEAPIFLKSEGSDSSGYEHIMLFTLVAFLEPRGDSSHTYKLWYRGFTLGKLLRHDDRAESARPLLPRGDEPSTLQRMREWLEACDADLVSWSKRLTDTKLPTRVLDLQSLGNDQDSDLRLFETKGISGRYATLSYCWGGYQGCRTLKANLEERCARIRYSELPALFQQAITVTRGLRIRYLWIDALCIVQDDAEDWKYEAARMADVYWNGACRLAVTHCQNPTESFFPPREVVASVRVPSLEEKEDHAEARRHSGPASSDWETEEEEDYGDGGPSSSSDANNHGQQPIIEQENPKSTLDSFQDRFSHALVEVGAKYDSKREAAPETHHKVFFSLPRNYERDVDLGHLNSRGWVLQERLLAPRTIHFTADHMYFEDQDDICGEDWVRRQFTWRSCIKKRSKSSRSILFPEDSIRDFEGGYANYATSGRAAELLMQRALFAQRNYRHLSDSSDTWLTIAESFNRCNFTYQTDRLVAIAGLVKRKQSTPGSQYAGSRNFFGLWEKTLHVDLAWVAATTRTSPQRLTRLNNLNLPSWTWIAYDGPITFTKDRRDRRNPGTVPIAPTSEIRLVHTDAPDLPDIIDPLPLKAGGVCFRVATRLRKLPSTTTAAPQSINLPAASSSSSSWTSREQVAAALPYIRLDPHTSTMPMLLGYGSSSGAQPVLDQNGSVVGIIVFDEGGGCPRATDDLYCAHISTLKDERRDQALWEVQADDGEQRLGGSSISQPPILAYALVLRSVGGGRDVFARVGLAEVGYDWIMAGDEQEVSLL
ncbi:heterokaryon incompatibility protein-domain-containing protein [Chaetomium strumarium]|uniref:Heterokaryon incompatibility protein-domain-containing protein n=1 Tax=Chaetomium strumarium TaxID=1170767 RepID=A0AAJ0GMN7_9PEZI|nr:heterokaryon incompatibility protein-domain-containing protein [Chaetomium strumarium]